MSDSPEFEADPQILGFANSIFERRSNRGNLSTEGLAAGQLPFVRELELIGEVIAAHDKLRRYHLNPSPGLDLKGTSWGPLEILEKVGVGAFGEVYRAREARLDREVALKFYHRQRMNPAQLTADVIEEGRLLARVCHPNVVTVHGAQQLDGRLGIWMEFVEGATLEDIIAERGPLDPSEVMAIGHDLCGALTALHDAGILHRDIKARNVVLEDSGRVVLMDLGISCEIDQEIPVQQYGTPLYTAPETLLANESSRQGDIYSLGVLLYFLASGSYPVTGETLADIRAAQQADQTRSLDSICPDLPEGLLRIVEKALARNRFERFTTAGDMARALADIPGSVRPNETDGPLGAGGTDRFKKFATGDQQARNHYLLGRYFWRQRTKNGLPKALECFRQAVNRDPDFALAHLGIAQCLNLISYWQAIRPRDGFAAARSAAERALTIDPSLGEARASLGCVSMCLDWDAVAAEGEFEQAVQMNPQSVFTRTWYALLLSSEGRHDDALAEVRASQILDPASLVIAIDAIVLSHAGRLNEALEIFRLGLQGDPESLYHHNHMGLAYLLSNELDEAETCLRTAIALSKGQEAWSVGMLALLLVHTGREREAHPLIAQLDQLAERRYVSSFCRLVPWLPLGREDKWSPLLDRAVNERDTYLIWMRTLGDRVPGLMVPQFADCLKKHGLLA